MIIIVSVCLGHPVLHYLYFLLFRQPQSQSVSPHCYYLGCVNILVSGGGQGPPAGLPAHQVSLRVGLTRVDCLDLGLRQLPANITDYDES